jgi:(E)-4-hydroxy-3-methylbut-2-enyl-diphosphate synthase
MSRYGDTPIGMVESAMEFLRIARDENYHQVVLSMKSSNPLVMVQAYRVLVQKMDEEFGAIYPLHLGVTEAGDGEDGRIKSAIGIGSLLEDGIGDTIRVSLTEDPEFEIPVCKDIVMRYSNRNNAIEKSADAVDKIHLPYDPFVYKRRESFIKQVDIPAVHNIGFNSVPIVIADYSDKQGIEPCDLAAIGYSYNKDTDKWSISDAAADYIYTDDMILDFALPGTLQVLCGYETWKKARDKSKYHPLLTIDSYQAMKPGFSDLHFLCFDVNYPVDKNSLLSQFKQDNNLVLILRSSSKLPFQSTRNFVIELMQHDIKCPIIIWINSIESTVDEQLIHFATEAGGLLIDGIGDGLWLDNSNSDLENIKVTGRTYMEVKNNTQFLNNTAFSILQATRTRISKTEYISCPSCGRTLFDLQETTGKIRAATQHLKGVKIAIMGCIVNGPGEMADADFGYVGSGPGKITLYKGKEVIKKNVPSEIAVSELIMLLKENEVWVEENYEL